MNIPRLSWLLVILLPFSLKFLGHLKFSRNIFKSKYFKLSSLLLVMFVLINFSVIFSYNLYGSKGLTYFIFPILMIPAMFFSGVFLNYKKLPFYPDNIIIINLCLFFGGILWVFLSVGHYFSWNVSITDLFFSQDTLSELNSTEGRRIQSFWSSDYSQGISAPSLDIFSSLGVSLLGLIICQLFFSKNKRQNIPLLFFIIIIFLMSLFSSIALGSRSPIIVMVCSLFTSIAYSQYVFISDFSGNKKSFKLSSNVIMTILFLFFLLLSISALYDNFSHVTSNTNLGSRFAEKGLETDRYDAWIAAVNQMWEFPWGGRVMKLPSGILYVHNIWLDQLYDAGIMPMILLIAFHLLQIPIFLDFFKLHLPLNIYVFVLGIIIAFLVSFTQAPVLQASIPFFASSCFFLGSIIRLTIDYSLLKHCVQYPKHFVQ